LENQLHRNMTAPPIRIIKNIKSRDSTKNAFKNLKLLRLPEIYKYSVLIFVYKFKNRLLPAIFESFYIENREIHQYSTRNANQFRTPLTKSKVAACFIKKTGVSIWKDFNSEISHSVSIGSFKRDVVTLLIKNY
jgi:hypothetical protein